MAEKSKINLSRAYTVSGKTYGPGEAEVPAGSVEFLQKKEEKAKQRLADGYEPPPPVTPSSTRGELHDPRKRQTVPTPQDQPASSDEGPRQNVAQVRQGRRKGGDAASE